MSTVVVWKNTEQPEHPTIWAVADTRYSRRGELRDSRFISTDNGPKLFEVDVIVRGFSELGFFDRVIHHQKIGLGFAGSATAALCIYSTAARMLSNLASPKNVIPSMSELHEGIAQMTRAYVLPIASPFTVELCSIGHCYISGSDQVFYAEAAADGSVASRLADFSREPFLLLGAHRGEILELITEKDAESPKFAGGHHLHRAPLSVVRDLVRDGVYSDIGGGVDLGILLDGSFRIFSNLRPNELNEDGRNATLETIGHDILGSIGKIGPCMVSLPGMA